MSKTRYMENDVYPAREKSRINEINAKYSGKPIAEIIVNGFFSVDDKWTVLYWNKAAEKLLNVYAADIVGKNLWKAFAASIPLEFYAVYHKAFEKNIPVHFQEYWGEMGSWFDVITYYCDKVLSVSFKSSNRSVDLETHASFQSQLQVKTSLYKFITELSNDCLWEWDFISKEIFWIDGGHKRMFGYPIQNALIPQSFWLSLIHPEDKPRLLREIAQLLEENTAVRWEVEYRCKKADGTYAWVQDRGHIIYEDNIATRMIGATQDITEKTDLQNRLAKTQLAREKEISRHVSMAREKERAAIAQDLLDNVSEVLSAAKLYAEMAKEDSVNSLARTQQSCNYIGKALVDILRISKALAPPFFQALGLVRSLKILTDDIAAKSRLQFTVTDSGQRLDELTATMRLHIYRIVQEQATNIVAHAHATLASIDIAKYDDEIVLFIADNGRGNDMTKTKNGSGLTNIKMLANLYQGSVTILSSPGKGYTLQVILQL